MSITDRLNVENDQNGAINKEAENFRWPILSTRELPGVGKIVKAMTSPAVNFYEDGRRSNGLPVPDPVRSTGLLIGSSQALGYLVADDQTISAHLEKSLPGVAVKNYGSIAQTLSQSVMYWQRLKSEKVHADFVLIVGGVFDLWNDCLPRPYSGADSTRIAFLYDQVMEKIIRQASTSPCLTPEGLEMAIQHSVIEIKNAIYFGREQKIPFAIVIIPTAYDEGADVSGIKSPSAYLEAAKTMKNAYRKLHERLKEIDAPELIDLSNMMDASQLHFLDSASHMTGSSYKLIAEAISEQARGVIGDAGQE